MSDAATFRSAGPLNRSQAVWTLAPQFPLNLLVTLAVAALRFYTVESAFLRLKDRFHRSPQPP